MKQDKNELLSSLSAQISNADITLGAISSIDEEANKILSNVNQWKKDSSNDINIIENFSSIEKDLCICCWRSRNIWRIK